MMDWNLLCQVCQPMGPTYRHAFKAKFETTNQSKCGQTTNTDRGDHHKDDRAVRTRFEPSFSHAPKSPLILVHSRNRGVPSRSSFQEGLNGPHKTVEIWHRLDRDPKALTVRLPRGGYRWKFFLEGSNFGGGTNFLHLTLLQLVHFQSVFKSFWMILNYELWTS